LSVPESPLELATDYLRRLAAATAAKSDAELLAGYARERDEDAFAQLIRRHGPMVLGVCRRALGPTPDADDAFQATFVALARQAKRISDTVPGWLFRVAVRTSRRALRCSPRSPQAAEAVDPSCDLDAVEWREVRRLLDDELNRLPDRWRWPLVLCYLDGLTRDEAARQLGWSLRTLHRRLDEARQRLRARVIRRGLGPAALAVAVLSAGELRSDVPAALLRATAGLTVRGATLPAASRALISRLSPTGGLAMKAVLSALILVGVLVISMSNWQTSEAAPPQVPISPPVLVRAPIKKERPPDDPLVKKVQDAQQKAMEFLKSQLKEESKDRWSWDDPTLGTLQKGGPSALATLALLESGLKPDDETITRGLKFLRTVDPENVYVVSLQTQAFCKANRKEDADRIKRNVQWLEKAAVWSGGNLVGWSYTAAPAGRGDNSNSRYAIAALYAAHRVGFKVSADGFWQAVRDMYIRTQQADGGWGYIGTVPKPTHTMTASGLLCLTLADDALGKEDKTASSARANGFGWLAANFRLENSPHTLYNFDVIAALGRASERKDFGTPAKKIEWYRLGAEWLLKKQKPNGSWMIDDALDRFPVVSTSFALRFLASRPE
jgi:RNA polymerase sigma factor (sigma-70 family)